MSKLARMAMEETFSDLEPLLHQVVHKFSRRYPGIPHDELFSVACERFVAAYRSNKRYTKLSTWLTNMVWWGLLDYYRSEAKQHRRNTPISSCPDNPLATLQARPRREFRHFLGDLTDDARFVALLATNLPPDIKLEARRRRPKAKEPVCQHALKEFLADLGWAAQRIAESFEEIRRALLN